MPKFWDEFFKTGAEKSIACQDDKNPEDFVEFFDGGQVDGAGVVPGRVPHAREGCRDQVKNVDPWNIGFLVTEHL